MFNNVTPTCSNRFRTPTAPGDRSRVAHTELHFFHDLSDESALSGDQVVDSSELSLELLILDDLTESKLMDFQGFPSILVNFRKS